MNNEPKSVPIENTNDGCFREYQEAASIMRHAGTLQLAALTAFIAITGGLLVFIYGTTNSMPNQIKLAVKYGGLLISLLFLLIGVSNSFFWGHFAKRACSLERNLNYKLYSILPGAPKFNLIRPTRTAIWFLYIVTAIFWLFTILSKI